MRIFAVIFFVVFCSILASGMWTGWDTSMVSEHGTVERAGLTLFALGAAITAARMPASAWPRWWAVPAIFVLFCLRELDMHNAFFDPGLLQTRIFTSPVPLWQKVVSAAAMAFILLTVGSLMIRGSGPFTKALLNKEGWAFAVVLGIGLAISAVLIDGADRQLAAIGVTLPSADSIIWIAVEEFLELGFGLALIFAVCTWEWPTSSFASHEDRLETSF